MKKTFTILFISLFSLGFSQSFSVYKINNSGVNTATVTNGYTLTETTSINSETNTKLKIKNNAASTQTFNVTRSIVSNAPALEVSGGTSVPTTYFCFGISCFNNNVNTPTSIDYTILLAAGQTATAFPTSDNSYNNQQPFIAYLEEGASVGVYKVRYKVFNVNNANDTLSFTIGYNLPAGINSLDKSTDFSFEIFPNPSHGDAFLNVSAVTETETKLVIVNNLGQVVKNTMVHLNTGANQVNLNTSDLSTGIYNVILSNDKGSISKSLNIIK